ncbi:hypothetical protein AAFF_G00317080 [Aldrovandia affinis]|uniref:Uncharacterized protein n=1 Tax=Aldrovandia affinis TaxID=143900 RepID=A0AAD7VZS5_9TELE|nr:hypothetical protein AAFF_G00317080 [Aldrovandia affinis]
MGRGQQGGGGHGTGAILRNGSDPTLTPAGEPCRQEQTGSPEPRRAMGGAVWIAAEAPALQGPHESDRNSPALQERVDPSHGRSFRAFMA